jgi:hypothetical protein
LVEGNMEYWNFRLSRLGMDEEVDMGYVID